MLFEERPGEGISIPLTKVNEWPTFYDPISGWLCIGQPITSQTCESVEFATNTVAVIDEASLRAIWLHPSVE